MRRVVRSAAFWRHPVPHAAVPVRSARSHLLDSPVREAFQRQAEGAFDPAKGDRRAQILSAKLQVDPQDVRARVELGSVYEQYSMDELALDQYTRALNLDPDCLPAVLGLARVGQRWPQTAAEALPAVEAFSARHPQGAPARSALGSMLDTVGDLAGAERAYRQGLEQQPGAAYLHNNLGFNLMLQKRLDEAVAEFRRALDLNPRSAVARNNLGVALALGGRQQEALQEFSKGGADRATAHNNLAVALLEQDRLEESRAELLKALSARSFFAPALENFKLVLERDSYRQALPVAVHRQPAVPADWLEPQPAAPAPEPAQRKESETRP